VSTFLSYVLTEGLILLEISIIVSLNKCLFSWMLGVCCADSLFFVFNDLLKILLQFTVWRDCTLKWLIVKLGVKPLGSITHFSCISVRCFDVLFLLHLSSQGSHFLESQEKVR